MNEAAANDPTQGDTPPPMGLYANVAQGGGVFAVAGQLPFCNGVLLHTGRVGETVDQVPAEEAAAQCTLNALQIVQSSLGAAWQTRARILRLSVFVACGDGDVAIPAIADAASLTLREALGERGVSARTAIGVARLPANAPVEIELTFHADITERISR